MYILAIEGSCNKLGIGILYKDKILSNLRRTYNAPDTTGCIPSLIGVHHRKEILTLLEESLKVANITLNEISIFCYTRGPGISAPLIICATVARTLAYLYDKPLIPVNHCIAHIEMGRLITKMINPVILYVSGGNNQLISYKSENIYDEKSGEVIKKSKRYKIFGETIDIAVGSFLDRMARVLNLPNNPSPGYNIMKRAELSNNYIKLPYSVKGMDVSFSGILTHCIGIVENKKRSKTEDFDSFVNDMCYSIQETVFSALVEITERALSFLGCNEVLIVGGVGCNIRLQEMMAQMLKDRNGKLGCMDERYCIDNGAMIGYTGYLMYESGERFLKEECDVTQRFRTDSVEVTWRE
ncbi:tRNA N6-adenosine threonylcarbamoyltransferase [Hamiltosporidium magnivora]|uniref:N(6)-L-threonylcarbamoyladenine synthase n=1 Tax=Hamiltosporidium magnivora TaxID=148818 RepID=A0A4Q9L2H7_9MICR|nr:tRNA N6-adenosine threonylcarbamoyltransferase [Hamiltosporidium magnivora]